MQKIKTFFYIICRHHKNIGIQEYTDNVEIEVEAGGTRMARGGSGSSMDTIITYFSGMKIDPKYAFLHAFFLICPSCPFQNLSL